MAWLNKASFPELTIIMCNDSNAPIIYDCAIQASLHQFPSFPKNLVSGKLHLCNPVNMYEIFFHMHIYRLCKCNLLATSITLKYSASM